MEAKLAQLKQHLARVSDLLSAANLLEWDQETYMPDGGAQARANQIATLRSLAHQIFTADEVGKLLTDLQPALEQLDPASDEAAIIRLGKRYYDQQRRVPSTLVARIEEAARIGTHVWQAARAENDFPRFVPYLQKIVDLKLEYVSHLSKGRSNPYDVLLDLYEPGIDHAQIEAVFAPLKRELIDLIRAIGQRPQVDDSMLHRHYPRIQQIAFSREVVTTLGYDFTCGRLDLSAHPFTIGFDRTDVRITTRVLEDFLPSCLMGTIHEAGHAMYEQGISPSLSRIGFYPDSLGEGASMSVHESQSRFFENVLGRSRAFWEYFYPKAQALFPQALGAVPLEAFYRALNRVQPSLIRVEADEVTYGLHIMLRFELENDLINGRVKVTDLPAEWNARMEQYLGIVPPTDAQGVLQDIHWSAGLIGYFPDYLLGSIFSVQLWEKLRADHPGVLDEVRTGRFETVLAWLREKIHRHGRKFTLPQLAERITGGPLSWQPYLAYLKGKAADVYGL
ncbi:MAG: carboxypeptidase M32 [Anaerolineae bacterium]